MSLDSPVVQKVTKPSHILNNLVMLLLVSLVSIALLDDDWCILVQVF